MSGGPIKSDAMMVKSMDKSDDIVDFFKNPKAESKPTSSALP